MNLYKDLNFRGKVIQESLLNCGGYMNNTGVYNKET